MVSTNESALVIFSGGQDSTTCLFWAKKHFKNVYAISFDYGQRHKKELECAKSICKEVGVEHEVLDLKLLNQLAPNALTREDIEVSNNEAEINTEVSGRNLLFISFASIYAKNKGIKDIITGVCETDFSGYPDCRNIFIQSLNVTINLSMDDNFNIHTPLMWLDKSQVWELSDDLGYSDFVREKTLTCYNGIIGDGCKVCPACILRNQGLKKFLERKGELNE